MKHVKALHYISYWPFQGGASFVDPFCFLRCVFFRHTILYVPCNLVVACREKADLLAPVHVVFSCGFVIFPYGVLGQVWYLIVMIPDLFRLHYFVFNLVFIYPLSYIEMQGSCEILVFHHCFLCKFGSTQIKVSKEAKIRNRYNPVPHLTQDTTWESDKNTIKHHIHVSVSVNIHITQRRH